MNGDSGVARKLGHWKLIQSEEQRVSNPPKPQVVETISVRRREYERNSKEGREFAS